MIIKGFSKEQNFTPAWNDNGTLPEANQLKTKLTIFNMGELLDVIDVIKSVGFDKGTENQMTPDQMRIVLSVSGAHLTKHVSFVSGNENFDMTDVVSFSQFFALAIELLFQLVNISSPSDQDVKN